MTAVHIHKVLFVVLLDYTPNYQWLSMRCVFKFCIHHSQGNCELLLIDITKGRCSNKFKYPVCDHFEYNLQVPMTISDLEQSETETQVMNVSYI